VADLSQLLAKASGIKLLAMDVDGVLTTGEIVYATRGGDAVEEIKVFNAKDGLGLSQVIHAGIETAIITGRQSAINVHRVQELGIHHLFQGVKQKLPVLEALLAERGWTLAQGAYIGDDLPDLPVLEAVGLPCCPADAVAEVQAVCTLVTQQPGGRGAVRELTDLLLRARTPSLTEPV